MAKAKQETAVERLNDSLEAAQKAATSLRDDIGSGGRDLLRDVERMISATRRDAAKLGQSVRDDLSELHKSIVKQPNGRKATGSARKPARKPAGKKKAPVKA